MTESPDPLGATIAGKYRLRRRIGIGGMGTVYEAEHIELGKRVAIKIIDADGAMSAELVLRFKREARTASAVESENIVQVFDVGFDPEAGLFMVMEFLVGEDLEHRLRREGKLDVVTAVHVAQQTSRALAKAHASRVVHRDLKPANIFLTATEDGALRVKVLDFGISKITSDVATASRSPDALALTQEGVALGTPQYMSPEQARGLATIDGRTDIWSLGAVLYEALSGRPAYPPLAPEQVMYKLLREDPAPLASIAPWVPAELARVVHDALTRDVGQRIPDCQTFARRLAAAVPSAGLTSRASASWPAALVPDDAPQTEVLARDDEAEGDAESDDEAGPDTFRDGVAPVAGAEPMSAPATQPETQRGFPPAPPPALAPSFTPLSSHSAIALPHGARPPTLAPVSDAPTWNDRARRSPSTLGNAIRSLSLPPLPPRAAA